MIHYCTFCVVLLIRYFNDLWRLFSHRTPMRILCITDPSMCCIRIATVTRNRTEVAHSTCGSKARQHRTRYTCERKIDIFIRQTPSPTSPKHHLSVTSPLASAETKDTKGEEERALSFYLTLSLTRSHSPRHHTIIEVRIFGFRVYTNYTSVYTYGLYAMCAYVVH